MEQCSLTSSITGMHLNMDVHVDKSELEFFSKNLFSFAKSII